MRLAFVCHKHSPPMPAIVAFQSWEEEALRWVDVSYKQLIEAQSQFVWLLNILGNTL